MIMYFYKLYFFHICMMKIEFFEIASIVKY